MGNVRTFRDKSFPSNKLGHGCYSKLTSPLITFIKHDWWYGERGS